MLVPLICTIYGALTVERLVPEVPYVVWAALFAGTMTIVNLRGIRTTARINLVLCALMCGVVMRFMWVAVRFLLAHQGWHGLVSSAASD